MQKRKVEQNKITNKNEEYERRNKIVLFAIERCSVKFNKIKIMMSRQQAH